MLKESWRHRREIRGSAILWRHLPLNDMDWQSIVSTVPTFLWQLQLAAESTPVWGRGDDGGRSRRKTTASLEPWWHGLIKHWIKCHSLGWPKLDCQPAYVTSHAKPSIGCTVIHDQSCPERPVPTSISGLTDPTEEILQYTWAANSYQMEAKFWETLFKGTVSWDRDWLRVMLLDISVLGEDPLRVL